MAAIRISPFAHSEGIELALQDFDDPISGRRISPVKPGRVGGEGDLPVSYDVAADSWRKLTIGIKAKLSSAELRRVVPPGSDLKSELSLVVSLACPSTKYRHAVTLAGSDGVWSGDVTLLRDDLRGIVTLRPMLVLSKGSSGPPAVAGYAHQRGSVVATGERLHLLVDEPGFLPTQALVTTVWEDFSSSENSWRREHSNSLFHLEPYSERPQLFLNARYSEIREILNSEAAKGAEAAVRDLTAALIADSVWVQLTIVAATAVTLDETEEAAAIGGAAWKRTLLESLLPALYPDEVNARERLRRLAADLHEGTGAASLVSRIGSVVQDLVATHRIVEAAVRAHERLRTVSENGE